MSLTRTPTAAGNIPTCQDARSIHVSVRGPETGRRKPAILTCRMWVVAVAAAELRIDRGGYDHSTGNPSTFTVRR